jgi:hypothetical protein
MRIHALMMFNYEDEEWYIQFGLKKFQIKDDMDMEIWIRDQYHEAILDKDCYLGETVITLEQEIVFALRKEGAYEIRISDHVLEPYLVPELPF